MKSISHVRVWGTLFVVALVSACASPKINPDKKIEVTESFFPDFKQDGKSLNETDIVQEMKLNPESESNANTSEFFYYTSLMTAAVGGFELGASAGKAISGQPTATDFWIGVGSLGASLILIKLFYYNLVKAVKINNATLAHPKASFRLVPVPKISWLNPQAGLGNGLSVGMTFEF